MARPTSPLISREAIVVAALRIVDEDGIGNLSIRKIGAALGVDGSSLYHYFAGKDAIIDAVAARVLSRIRPAEADVEDWKSYLVETCLEVRRAVNVHPGITPALADRRQWKIGLPVFERTAQIMGAHGLGPADQLLVWETLDALTLGGVLITASVRRATSEVPGFETDFPAVHTALNAAGPDEETRLALSIRAFLAGLEVTLAEHRPTHPRGGRAPQTKARAPTRNRR